MSIRAAAVGASTPWRYYREGWASDFFKTGPTTRPFRTLWEAITSDWITYGDVKPVPTSRPDLGLLSNLGPWSPWDVCYKLNHGDERGMMRRASFVDPREAFIFAMAMQKLEGASRSRSWFVCLSWELDRDYASSIKRFTYVKLEVLPASWWQDQQKAADKRRRESLRRAA